MPIPTRGFARLVALVLLVTVTERTDAVAGRVRHRLAHHEVGR